MTSKQLTLEPLGLESAELLHQTALWPFASVIVPTGFPEWTMDSYGVAPILNAAPNHKTSIRLLQ